MLDRALLRHVLEAAVLADSPLNCQPWRFEVAGKALHVIDPHRALLPLDVDNHATLMSFGGALENIAIAATQQGFAAQVLPFPEPGNDYFVAEVRFDQIPELARDPLAEAIPARRSNPSSYLRRPLDAASIEAIGATVADNPTLQLHAVDAPYAKRELAELLIAAERMIWQSPPARRSVVDRLAAGDLTLAPAVTTRWRSWLLAALLRRRWRHRVNCYRLVRTVTHRKILLRTSHLVAISARECSPIAYLSTGRTIQRVWLELTLRGVQLQPLDDVIGLMMMYNWNVTNLSTLFGDRRRQALRGITESFHRLFDLPLERTPLFLCRLGWPVGGPGPSGPRRALSSFLGRGLRELLEDDLAR